MGRERRELTRFLVQDNAFAALGLRLPKVGRIKDISTGGLAFDYLTDYVMDEINNGKSDKSVLNINIFLSKNGFHLSDVPCAVVYDVVGDILTNSFIIKRRCGVQFQELTEKQMTKLGFFLADYAVGIL